MSSVTVAMLYMLFALGGVAVYLALPGGQRSARIAGLIFGLSAIAGFAVLAAGHLFGEDVSAVYFCILAAVAIFGAGKVITHPKPVYSALYFVLVVLAVAFLMVMQEAEFLGIALIIVYAGAILVTYVFVIMLAQQSGASAVDGRAREPLLAVLVGFVTMAAVVSQAGHLPGNSTAMVDAPDAALARLAVADGIPAVDEPGEADDEPLGGSNTAQVGFLLFSQYVVALEIAGLLLLLALIGAVALVMKRVPRDVPVAPAPPLGEIGKEVPPF
ncbi:MAG: NADH-quinone oxidoreductase subunit J [Phycisphaerae bacterium]|nr:NADH-quinone oxidoreductase subunit J [Phycisphaerae bacterium]